MKRKKGEVSLERALSKLGFTSRTQARIKIKAGFVSVNGKIIFNPLYPTNPEKAKIKVEGESVKKSEFEFFILNKKKGTVTTKSDEKNRKTIFTDLPHAMQKLHAVGRLDMHTSGLIFLTNDTQFSNWLTDPMNAIQRQYVLNVRNKITNEDVLKCKMGIQSDGEVLIAEEVIIIKSSQKESMLKVTLLEGKNREIRRMFEALGNEVIQLKRISFGGIQLEALSPGAYKKIQKSKLELYFPKYFKKNKN